MARERVTKTQREIERRLKETGLPYRIEQGGSHRKIILAGEMIAVFSNGNPKDNPRGLKNIYADIRRTAQRMQHA